MNLSVLEADGVPARLGQPDSAAALREKGGFLSIEELERLLDLYYQTIRGTGLQRGTSG